MRTPTTRITDELVHLIFCPPVRDHRKAPLTAGDVAAVVLLLATMVLLGFAVGAEWVGQ